MKKSILLSSLILAAGIAHADNWYAGLTAGQSFANNSGTIGFNDGTDVTAEKKTFNGKQFFTGSLFFGRAIQWKDQGNILMDVAYQYNNEKASAKSFTRFANTTATITRPMTFVFNVGFEKPILSDMAVFLKVGGVISQFDTKFVDSIAIQSYDGKNTQRAFGFVPTLGVQKDIAGMTLGLSYSYYLYQEMASKKVHLATGIEYSNKITPRYHVFEARISKKF